jgi:hypothetical protein
MSTRFLLGNDLDVQNSIIRPCRLCWNPILGDMLPPHTKLITPPSRWANPFMVKVKASETVDAHSAAVAQYREWIMRPERAEFRSHAKRVLAGWNLACKCKVGAPCHGDVLLQVANDHGKQLLFVESLRKT